MMLCFLIWCFIRNTLNALILQLLSWILSVEWFEYISPVFYAFKFSNCFFSMILNCYKKWEDSVCNFSSLLHMWQVIISLWNACPKHLQQLSSLHRLFHCFSFWLKCLPMVCRLIWNLLIPLCIWKRIDTNLSLCSLLSQIASVSVLQLFFYAIWWEQRRVMCFLYGWNSMAMHISQTECLSTFGSLLKLHLQYFWLHILLSRNQELFTDPWTFNMISDYHSHSKATMCWCRCIKIMVQMMFYDW